MPVAGMQSGLENISSNDKFQIPNECQMTKFQKKILTICPLDFI
jgi:hypothetical protein